MTLLELPGRHHALHVLGLLARGNEKRFSELVRETGHHDAEIGRALEYLKQHRYVRSRTLETRGKRIILAYGTTKRGEAAWEAFQAYGQAIRERAAILGRLEVQAVENVLET